MVQLVTCPLALVVHGRDAVLFVSFIIGIIVSSRASAGMSAAAAGLAQSEFICNVCA